MNGQETLYALGMKELIGFGVSLVLLMLAGFGGMLQYFIKGKLADLKDAIDTVHEDVEMGNRERRKEVADIRDAAYRFELYVEREFVKKSDYIPSITRLHERFEIKPVLTAP